MKILLVNCTYKDGSTGKIVSDCAEYYRKASHEVIIAYGSSSNKEADFNDPQVHQIRTVGEARLHVRLVWLGVVMLFGGMYLAYFRLRKLIKTEKPDIVHLHCINGYTVNIYRTLKFLGKKGIPTVVTHHGEFFYTGACGYAYDCTKYIDQQCVGCEALKYATGTTLVDYAHRSWLQMKRSFDYFDSNKLFFTAVSPWVRDRAKVSPLVNNFKCEVVKNGVNINVFKYILNKDLFNSIPNLRKKIVLHATGIFAPDDKDNIKGGWYIVELAERMPDVTFVVVATTTKVERALPDNLFIWGKAKSQQELAMLYSNADLTVITSRQETFSMIVAESLCCGTPIVGFKAGGPESIAMEEYCSFVDYDDVDELQKEMMKMLVRQINKEELATKASEIYDKNAMASSYMKIYNDMIANN